MMYVPIENANPLEPVRFIKCYLSSQSSIVEEAEPSGLIMICMMARRSYNTVSFLNLAI